MVIGIIGAMDEEVEILINNMQVQLMAERARMKFYIGKLWGRDVVVVTCGIGKVNAASCTQILIDSFEVSKVINVGIAGGIGKDIVPGDVVIADTLVQHDMNSVAFGFRVGQIPRLDTFDFKCDINLIANARLACENIIEHRVFVGRIATGDEFIADEDKIKWLSSEFGALACEMEGGSIAQVCYINAVPFVVIRSISDNANTGAHMDIEKFKLIAIKNSTNIIKNMLQRLE